MLLKFLLRYLSFTLSVVLIICISNMTKSKDYFNKIYLKKFFFLILYLHPILIIYYNLV